MKVKELRAYAKKNGIKLHGATRKADILYQINNSLGDRIVADKVKKAKNAPKGKSWTFKSLKVASQRFMQGSGERSFYFTEAQFKNATKKKGKYRLLRAVLEFLVPDQPWVKHNYQKMADECVRLFNSLDYDHREFSVLLVASYMDRLVEERQFDDQNGEDKRGDHYGLMFAMAFIHDGIVKV